jgi:hypothetical protein
MHIPSSFSAASNPFLGRAPGAAGPRAATGNTLLPIFDGGLSLNGVQLNGVQLNGVQLNGVQLNGVQLNGVQLNGTLFSAQSGSGAALSGADLVGTTFEVTVTEAGQAVPYQMKLGAIYIDPENPSSDVHLYDVEYRRADSSQWSSLCKDIEGRPIPAIPLRNHWNMSTGARIDSEDAVTFACTNGALAKCVRWGYRPWAKGTRCFGSHCFEISLKDYHQACTRMVRADYCGNGRSYTVDGTAIDVFDNLSPAIQSRGTTWRIEAKWTPNGATCLGKTRAKALIEGFKYPKCGRSHEDEFEKCENDDYAIPFPSLIANGFAG